MYFSKMKTTAARISSQVCSARYPIPCPAVLKRKLTIAPISPGSAEAAFAPTALRPFANLLPRDSVQSVGDCSNNSPDCDAGGEKDRCHRQAIFFEDLLDPFSERLGRFSFRYLSLKPEKLFISCCLPFSSGLFIEF